MPAQVNAYSVWLSAQQNPICPKAGPTGSAGPKGPTGPGGPSGAPGQNGLTTGLQYFFYTEQPGSTYSPQPNVNFYGPAGFSMNIVPGVGPGLPPGNPNPAYSLYNGYLAFMNAAGYGPNGGSPTTPAHLASFNLPLTGKLIIPGGPWTFSNNIYSYTTVTPSATIPFNMYITISLYTVATSTKTLIGGDLKRAFSINNPLSTDDTPYINSVVIPQTFAVNNAVTDYLIIEFFVQEAYPFTSGQLIEFWSEGDSISQVVTTFAPQSGPTGSQGPSGPTGPPGSTIGTAGQLAWFPSTNTINSTPGITTDGLNLNVGGTATFVGKVTMTASPGLLVQQGAILGGLQVNGASTFNNPVTVNATSTFNNSLSVVAPASLLMGPSTTLNIDGNVSNTSGPINFINGGGITATVGNITAVGLFATVAASIPALLNGSLGATAPGAIQYTSANTQATMVIAGWRITWGAAWIPGTNTTGNVGFTPAFSAQPLVFCSAQTGGTAGFYTPVNVFTTYIENMVGYASDGSPLNVPCWYIAIGPA